MRSRAASWQAVKGGAPIYAPGRSTTTSCGARATGRVHLKRRDHRRDKSLPATACLGCPRGQRPFQLAEGDPFQPHPLCRRPDGGHLDPGGHVDGRAFQIGPVAGQFDDDLAGFWPIIRYAHPAPRSSRRKPGPSSLGDIWRTVRRAGKSRDAGVKLDGPGPGFRRDDRLGEFRRRQAAAPHCSGSTAGPSP